MENMVIGLEGLTCSNCGAKIENDTKKINGVKNASVNIMRQEIAVDFEGGKENIFDNVKKITKKYEPEVEVVLKDKKAYRLSEPEEEEEGGLKGRLIKYAIGLALFVAAILVKEPKALSIALFISSYLIFGLDVLIRAVKNILKGQVFDENFLMSISTLGAIAIGEMPEAVFVMFFYQVGEMFQDLAVEKSRKSIRSLMDIRPDHANVLVNGEIVESKPETVNIDDIIVVKPGERMPLDGIVMEGESAVDTSALTGESVPRSVRVGQDVLSGTINLNGMLKVKVTKNFANSTVVKILELTENAASKKTKTEQFITKFARVYTPVVVLAAAVLAFVPPIFTPAADLTIWVSRALVFLVVSCPCALVLSVPLGFFSGIGEASKNGILIKGSNHLQALCNIDTVVMDKTGTITEGVFKVVQVKPKNGVDEKTLLKVAAYAEKMSTHPIAKSIVETFLEEDKIDITQISDYEEIVGHGVSAVISGQKIFAGNSRLMEKEGVTFEEYKGMGSVVYLAGANGYMGRIIVSDKIKEGSKKAIEELKNLGIKETVILTGDSEENSISVGKEVGADKVFSKLLPGDKVGKVEELYKKSPMSKILFVGDGINDAPVLSRVEVGVAMGGMGSDAAIEAADVVIMNDNLEKLSMAIKIARSTNKIVKQNIVFALSVKAVVLVLGAMGLASMWLAVFADVGVSFIAILNSMRKKL